MTTQPSAIARLRHTWWLLMALTLVSGATAETLAPSAAVVVAICVTVAVKGSQVIDHLMGLRRAGTLARGLMQVYFLVVPGLIGAVVIATG